MQSKNSLSAQSSCQTGNGSAISATFSYSLQVSGLFIGQIIVGQVREDLGDLRVQTALPKKRCLELSNRINAGVLSA